MLVANRREVLRYAWSVRFMFIAGLLSGSEIALPIIDGYVDIPRGIFAGLSLLATAGATIARFVVQRSIREGGA